MPNTREKLIELLYTLNLPSDCDDDYEWMADRLIANGVTIQKDYHWATEQAYKNGYADGKPKWIPVSERLPEVNVPVLVYNGEYVDGREFYDLSYVSKYGVTHWMPLPEPPKGE